MSFNYRTHHHSRFLQFIDLLAIVAGAVSSLSVRANPQTSAGKVPLTHETLWLMKRVGAPNPSPDGKWVVFSLVEPAYDEKGQV